MSETTVEKSAQERLDEVLAEEALGKRALEMILSREGYPAAEIETVLARTDWDEQLERAIDAESDLIPLPSILYHVLCGRGFENVEADLALKERREKQEKSGEEFTPQAFIWQDMQSLTGDVQASVQQVFGFNKITEDPAQVQAALDGDPAARCRIMASSLLDKGISRQRLQEVLEEVGLPARMVREQIRDLKPNWKVQAVKVAEQAVVFSEDRESIQADLRSAGFTPVQVAYAMNTAHLHDAQAATAFARWYIENTARSEADLRSELKDRGYTPEEIESVLQTVGAEDVDWQEAGAQVLRTILAETEEYIGGPDRFREEMLDGGFTAEQLEAAEADADWLEAALRDFTWQVRNGLFDPRIITRKRFEEQVAGLGYPPEIAAQAGDVFFSDKDEMQTALRGARASAETAGPPPALRAMIEDGGFRGEQVDWIMDRIFIDPADAASVFWDETMNRLMQEGIVPSPRDMLTTLVEDGFDEQAVRDAESLLEVEWDNIAQMYAMSLRAQDVDEKEIRAEMLDENFDRQDVDSALAATRGVNAEEAQQLMEVYSLMLRLREITEVLERMRIMGANDPEQFDAVMEEMTHVLGLLADRGVTPENFGDFF